MSKIAIGFAILIGVIVIVTVLYFVSIFAQMIFVVQISEWKISRAKAFELNDESIKLTDITPANSSPLEGDRNRQHLKASKSAYYIVNTHEIVETYDEIKEREYQEYTHLSLPEYSIDWVIKRTKIYEVKDGKRDSLFFEFPDNDGPNIWWAYGVSKDRVLLGISYQKKAENELFEFIPSTKELKKVATDVNGYYGYPSHLVRIFEPEGFKGTLVVYYTGSHLFGFGGDSFRPRQSHLMLYNDTFPEGKKLLSLSYKSGLIAEIQFTDGKLILTGDCSRPRQVDKHERPQKTWQVEASFW